MKPLDWCLLVLLLVLSDPHPYLDGSEQSLLRSANAQSITGGGEDGLFFGSIITSYSFTRDDFSVLWADTNTTDQAVSYLNDQVFSYMTTHGPVDESQVLPGRTVAQLPVVGGAVVLVYNLAGLPSQLVLDGPTVARLWSGNLTGWDDPQIDELNPGNTLTGPVLLAYSPDTEQGSISAVFRQYLASWGATGEINEQGGAGAVFKASSAQERIDYVEANPGAITYLTLVEAQGLPIAALRGPAGSTTAVVASPASILLAMDSFTEQFIAGQAVMSIINPTTATAWPISYITYITMPQASNLTNCVAINEFILFVSWVILNNQAATQANTLMHSVIPIGYRRTVLDSLSIITCNGEQATTTSYIVGMGSLFNPFPTLGYYYPSSSFKLKYFTGNSATSLANLKQDTIDFGQSSTPLLPRDLEELGDAIAIPGYCFGLTPAYNIPELIAREPLRLDWETIAGIYLGTVTMWNDTAIQNLNPELAPFLPQKAIRIVYQSNNSSITLTFNTAMGQRVPEYAQVIGFVSGFGDSPAIKNGAGVPVNGFGFPQMLDATTYSFGLTISQQLTKKVLPVSLWNTAGRLVSPTTESVLSAIQDNVDLLNSGADIYTLYFAPGENSWPIIAINSMIFHSRNMPDCRKAKALVDWIYWIQTDPFGKSIMDSSGFVAPYRVQEFTKTLFKKLASVTCEGVHVSQLYGCVTEDGLLCSDHGTCTEGVCSCEAGWVGSLCDTVDSRSSDSSSSPVLGLALGIALPVVVLIVCLALLVVLIVFLAMRRGKESEGDYYIPIEELELGDLLGAGGFGEVYKAKWKGTEVAAKLLPRNATDSREKREAFVQEMRVMSKLRHPNVVLFMAACKKPPILCIVMEYMALGSVFDLINNDLVPEVPMGLKLKMTFQAAKGMHFLHSSDIVHRDLKSLNLLLDNKWNVKVSDFGLTAIKDSIGKGGDKALVCSVPWTAPEVLQDEVGEDVDYTMADVYSFGIVLWEVLMREQPYAGKSAPQIAVAVIRDDIRPTLNHVADNERPYVDLMTSCWDRDPIKRPVFLDVMNSIQQMLNDQGSSAVYGRSSTSGTQSSSSGSSLGTGVERASDGSAKSESEGGLPRDPAPRRNVSFAVCDLARFNEAWQREPVDADRAIEEYVRIIRKYCSKHGGYVFSTPSLHSGGTVMISFARPHQAACFAVKLQRRVEEIKWKLSMSRLPSRVAIHYHSGVSVPASGGDQRLGYQAQDHEEACRLNVVCPLGGVLCSAAFVEALQSCSSDEQEAMEAVGQLQVVPHVSKAEYNCSLLVDASSRTDQQEESALEKEDEDYSADSRDKEMGLCSSNCCPWIVDSRRISLGESLGEGNYGRVNRGTYNGKPVAVKRLFNSRLDDRGMLMLRREAAILSDLVHPNIVQLIGLSLSEGNLILVMELVERGSLHYVLADRSLKLSWPKRLSMLRDAALGINYLHSLGVIHRDLKSHNLLVDENWGVKVGDFGFATAKQDNATMTRCGTPSWTAPEILSPPPGGAKYDESVDVYSFGIVMWEVLTRRAPYHEKNAVCVAVDVIQGQRPPIPPDTDKQFAQLMQRCWDASPRKRPSMDEIMAYLNSALDKIEV